MSSAISPIEEAKKSQEEEKEMPIKRKPGRPRKSEGPSVTPNIAVKASP